MRRSLGERTAIQVTDLADQPNASHIAILATEDGMRYAFYADRYKITCVGTVEFYSGAELVLSCRAEAAWRFLSADKLDLTTLGALAETTQQDADFYAKHPHLHAEELNHKEPGGYL